jgi:hypothetical protein
MTGISLHMKWPLTFSCMAVSPKDIFLHFCIHSLIWLGVSPLSLTPVLEWSTVWIQDAGFPRVVQAANDDDKSSVQDYYKTEINWFVKAIFSPTWIFNRVTEEWKLLPERANLSRGDFLGLVNQFAFLSK